MGEASFNKIIFVGKKAKYYSEGRLGVKIHILFYAGNS
jgi:hypothetical protein